MTSALIERVRAEAYALLVRRKAEQEVAAATLRRERAALMNLIAATRRRRFTYEADRTDALRTYRARLRTVVQSLRRANDALREANTELRRTRSAAHRHDVRAALKYTTVDPAVESAQWRSILDAHAFRRASKKERAK